MNNRLTPSTCLWLLVLTCWLPPAHIWAQTTPSGPKYFHQLDSAVQFDQLKGKPAVEKYGQVESVKVIWDLKKDQFYFISSHHFKWHYNFCKQELGYWQNRHIFNTRNYANVEGREFVLANLNHYLSTNLWTAEFSAADDISAELTVKFMNGLRQRGYFGDSLSFFTNTEQLVTRFAALDSTPTFRLVSAEDIYAGQTYQPLNCKSGFGYLRRVEPAQLEDQMPGMRDIVVLNGSALDIPAVAGLLTTEFQTPLSHLNVLCKNRGTPFIAQKNIFEDPRITALEDKLVYFAVYPDSFLIRPAEMDEAQSAWNALKPRKLLRLRANLKTSGLVPMSKINKRSINTVGGKASNFGILARIARSSKTDFSVPEGGFAIP
ncbi:MAG: hypothetical protein AAF570_21425, partial [Bacteroidota bacterium]